ncbi:hypothetical protein [Candidatus Nitrosocosmicus sp. SS]|uniref:hypothetical protein n=1 Tax=Candidatus Nitrosocosmicus agrestis TaxID=2563600 RepID=UPI0018A863C9|nr:hypothetical protein [Candidatus Nitrosocosmicus sp. SS]MDR4490444.1 hypothetical protein [Candidatus Nitrosocosmicus sp.]
MPDIQKIQLISGRFTCTLVIKVMDIELNERLRAPFTAVRKPFLVLTPVVLLKRNMNSRIDSSTKHDILYLHNSNLGCTMILAAYLLLCFMVFFDSILRIALFKNSLESVKKDCCGITVFLHQ